MKILLGSFGAGKTSYVLEQCINLIKTSQSFWIIVPSRIHKNQIYLDILKSTQGLIGNPILTLSEVQNILLEKLYPNPCTRPVSMNNFEKFLTISSIIECHQSKFRAFQNISSRSEIIKMIYRVIQHLRDQNIINLSQNQESEDKIHDVELILEEYQKILTATNTGDTKYEIDSIINQINRLNSDFLPEYIFIDGFIDFTVIQFNFIKHLITFAEKHNKNIYISLTNSSDSISQQTILLFKKNFPHAEKITLKHSSQGTLLAESFLNNTPISPSCILKLHEIQAVGKYKEIQEIVNQIKKLCLFEKHTFEDILIITHQQDKYLPIISSVLRNSNIPFIFGKDDKLSQNPLIMFIKKCLVIMNEDLDHERLDFFSQSNYIRNDLCAILSKASESITIAIKGRKESWIQGISRQKEIIQYHNESLEDLDTLEQAITALCDHLFTLNPYQSYPIQDHIDQLVNILIFFDIQKKLAPGTQESSIYHIINQSIAKDYSALLKLKEIFHNLIKTMKNSNHHMLSLSSFIFFFNIITEETRYRSEIPQKNVIRILKPEDTRGIFSKSVFILGMNEGEFPEPPKYDLFDNQERVNLNSLSNKILGFPLWPTDTEYFQQQRLSFALSISRSQQNIFFCRTPVTEKGSYLGISHFLERIFNKKIPVEQIPHCNNQNIHDPILNNTAIFNLRQSPKSYYDYTLLPIPPHPLNNIQQSVEYYHCINQANQLFDQGLLPESDSLKYFGYIPNIHNITQKFSHKSTIISPTGLEKLGRCRYQGLWQEIWKLKAHKLPSYTAENADYGKLYHCILESYIQQTIDKKTHEILDQSLLHQILTVYISTSYQKRVFTFDYNYIYSILNIFLKKIEPQFRENQTAVFFELESGKTELINQQIPLNAEKHLIVYSRIDRINQHQSDNSYTIIDYKKSGIDTYKKYQKIPFHLFQGFLYSELVRINKKNAIHSICYAFLEKQEIFTEFPLIKGKKNVFNSICEFQELKRTEILRLLALMSQGNFSPFTLEKDIGTDLLDMFNDKFGLNIVQELPYKCSYCDLKLLCPRQKKLVKTF